MGVCVKFRQRRTSWAGRSKPSSSGVGAWPGGSPGSTANSCEGCESSRRRAALETPSASPLGCLIPSCHGGACAGAGAADCWVREKQKAASPKRGGDAQVPERPRWGVRQGCLLQDVPPGQSGPAKALNPGNRQPRGGCRAFSGPTGLSVDAFRSHRSRRKESLLKSPLRARRRQSFTQVSSKRKADLPGASREPFPGLLESQLHLHPGI